MIYVAAVFGLWLFYFAIFFDLILLIISYCDIVILFVFDNNLFF